MDDYEVIYLDDDERNSFFKDHRRTSSSRRPSGRRTVFTSRRPTIIRHHGSSGSAIIDRRPTQVVVTEPAPRTGLGGLTTGELVEIAAQILAAIQPLPGAPSAQGHVETDVENLVMYQTALATHAKRDEQLRTLGSLLGRLLK